MVDNLLKKLRRGAEEAAAIEKLLKGKEVKVSCQLHGIESKDRLIEAVQTGDISVVRKFLDFGLNPSMRDEYNRPLFFLVCRAGFVNVVSKFLEYNVDVNEASADGQTALHVAVSKKHVDVIKLLLVSGASLTAKTLTGLKPIDIANYKSEIWELLKNAENGILPETISYKIPELERVSNVPKPPEPPKKDKKKKKKKKKKK